VTATAFSGDLASLLPARPPSTVEVKRDDAPDGTITVEVAASMYGADATQTVSWFRGFGMQKGVYTAWKDETTGTSVYVNLFQFKDEKGAAGWTVGVQRGFADAGDFESGAYFERIEAGRWFAFKPSNGYSFMAAIFLKGTIAAWVHLRLPAGQTDLPLLTKVCEEQLARLP
jgi:hypothetical protein